MVVLAQLVRAPDCGSGGRRFEPGIPPKSRGFTSAFLVNGSYITSFDTQKKLDLYTNNWYI